MKILQFKFILIALIYLKLFLSYIDILFIIKFFFYDEYNLILNWSFYYYKLTNKHKWLNIINNI